MEDELLQFGGSLLAISLLVLIAWKLGLGREARLSSEDEARELADNAICGFQAVELSLDVGGKGALLRDAQGRILLLAPHGVNFTARLLDKQCSLERKGARLAISTGESSFVPASLQLGEATETWAKRLAALGG